jgi:hypothetical protein
MWKKNAVQVIPIVISSTGVIPKSLSQSLKRLNLHPNTYLQMQKLHPRISEYFAAKAEK